MYNLCANLCELRNENGSLVLMDRVVKHPKANGFFMD